MNKELFKVFLWKNFLFLKSSWLSSSLINLVCLVIVYAYLSSTYNVLTTPTVIYEPKTIDTLKSYIPGNNEDSIFYSPSNAFLDDLMDKVRMDLSLPTERIKTFANASMMILTLEGKQNANCFAIVFEEWPDMKFNHTLRYTISSSVTKISTKKRFVNDEDINGVLVISPLPSIALESIDGQRITSFGSLFVVLFNVLLLTTTLIPLVEEKHDGIKEFLVLTTPHNFLNGLTFFCIRFLVYLLFIFGSVIAAFYFRATGLVGFGFIILLFVLYSSAAMCYAFLISVCFNSVFYAKVGGFILLIIPYLFYLVQGTFSSVANVIFSTTTFLECLSIFQIFTNKHRQFLISDLFVSMANTKCNVFSALAILLLQSVFYMLLYNYLSRIFPGKGGLKQPKLFFLQPSFYTRKNRNLFRQNSTQSDEAAILIEDLSKKFVTKNRVIKIADRLQMEIKDRRITVLLGHNGAGKTTILNMIIGCVPKDSGKIIVSSERDVFSYRHLIGFCPQHTVFMQYMTCYQHLKFFAQLRGKSKVEADSLASELLTQLRLVEKAKEFGKNLSGGMKRRLSLGIALAGETKVVILDEPSSGLDVESRRELWDILLELRKSKSILITTHHMEEAEILGDTISILSNGKLVLTGSPLELKRKSGSGYVLKLRTDEKFEKLKTLSLIKASIPTAEIMNIVPPTVLINMPYSYKAKYTEVLERLEMSKEDLGINKIAVTDTSLEEVFLNSQGIDSVDSPSRNEEKIINTPYQKMGSDSGRWKRQVQAVFYEKFVFIRSKWIYSFIMFSLPVLAILFAILVMKLLASSPVDEGLKLNLQHLKGGFIYLRVPPVFPIKSILENEIISNGMQIRNLSDKSPVEEELLSIQSKNLYDFYEHAVGAIVLETVENEPRFTILHSSNIIHSSVILINLLDDAILKFMGDSNHSIEATYAPIQTTIDINPSSLYYFAAIVPIGFFFYMLYYVSLPYIENKSDFRILQTIPRTTYWISFFAFDVLLHTTICAICFIIQHIFMPTNLYNMDDQVLLTFTYLLYGFWYLPILYSMSIGFRSVSTLSTYLFFMFIVSSIVPFITSNNLQSMEHFEITIMVTSFLPDFALNHQLRVINENLFSHRRSVLTQNYSRKNIVSEKLLPSPSTFFVYAVFLLIFIKIFLIQVWDNLQRRQYLKELVMCCRCKRNGQLNQSFDEEDEALVRKEKDNIEDILRSNTNEKDSYPLLVQNLHKFYGRVHAVRGINFAVKRQECFGLLGVNGAGKTSTFQMITTSSTISGGNIMINGVSILENETLYKYRFGYCPQGDCLNSFMTSYQILKYMALLRDVTDVEIEVKYWLSQLNLLKYENVPIRYYSGGTKRKLNAAIAMIGSPSLVLLDEPTTGVDPSSRRFLWKCIQDFQNRDKTVVLTSHSMDECEHLCNRLAIMANGKFQCIGYIPDLKDTYGCGFTIKLLSNASDNKIDYITSALRKEFRCELREQHAGMITYFINDRSVKWSDVFRRTERFMNACKNLVQDYSVNETTLEDIFLKFDKKCRRVVTELEDVHEHELLTV